MIKTLKYLPKIWTALTFLLLISISTLLFFGRNFQNLRQEPILNVLPDLYDHVSNLSISFIGYITIGYFGLMNDMKTKQMIVIGIAIIMINLVVEFFISFLNTSDWIDAVYGICGVMFGFIFLFTAKKSGFKLNDL